MIKSYREGPESGFFLEELPSDSRPLLDIERERRPMDCLSRPRFLREESGLPGLLLLREELGLLWLVLGREDARGLEADRGRLGSSEMRESSTGRTFLCSAGFRRDTLLSILLIVKVPWSIQFFNTLSADALISDFDDPKHRTIADDI